MNIKKIAKALKNALAMRDNLQQQLIDIEQDIKQLHAKLESEVEKEAGVKCEITLTADLGEDDIPPEEWQLGDIVVCQRNFYDLVNDRKYKIIYKYDGYVRVKELGIDNIAIDANRDYFKFHSRPA